MFDMFGSREIAVSNEPVTYLGVKYLVVCWGFSKNAESGQRYHLAVQHDAQMPAPIVMIPEPLTPEEIEKEKEHEESMLRLYQKRKATCRDCDRVYAAEKDNTTPCPHCGGRETLKAVEPEE